MAGSQFVSDEVFALRANAIKEAEKTLNWIDLDQTVVYSITGIQERKSKWGACWILYLLDRNGNRCKVWAPSRLINDLKKQRQQTDRPFIKSLGQIKEGIKTINQYDLCFQNTQNPIQLFDKEHDMDNQSQQMEE